MEAMTFFAASQNAPFLVASAVVAILGVLELLTLAVGSPLSGMLEGFLPDAPHADFHAGLDAGDGHGFVDHALGWLNAGRVPFLVLVVVFLTGFAAVGFAVQWLAASLVGLLPWPVALAPAIIGALPLTRASSRAIARAVPREETYAVGIESLVGRVATVTLGPATRDAPGKGRVTGPHGNTHFVRLRPADAEGRLDVGAAVLLTSQQGGLFDAIAAPDSLLIRQ